MNINELYHKINTAFPISLYMDSITNLSNGLVIENTQMINYDKIKEFYCKKFKISSADALYIKARNVFLIEFKQGFNLDNKDKKESERRSIRLKALESELLLEKIIMDESPRQFNLQYIAVIDSKCDPIGAQEEIILAKSKIRYSNNSSEKKILLKELTENSLLLYKKEISGKRIFYDKVKVLYEYEFNVNNL